MPIPPTRRRQILAVLVFSTILIWLDNTILGNVMETLTDPARGLGATMDQLQWATGSYTLVFATLMFTAGAVGDRFGHRTVLITGMAVFGTASAWAAYSHDAGHLIAARAVMGLGSALIMPASMAILTWTFPGPERAGALGIFSASSGIGLAGGPLLAGALLGHFWWGSVFLVNVPVVVVALVGIVALVPNFRSPTRRSLDPVGLLLSICGLAALAYGLIRAGQLAAWSPVSVWAPTVAGAVLLVAFVLVELRIEHPSFDPRFFTNAMFAGGNLALALLFFVLSGSSLFAAFYLQGARGFSPLQAGLIGLPASVGVMVGAPLATRLVRHLGVRPVTAVALAMTATCLGLWNLFGLHTPIVLQLVIGAFQGLSIGMVIAPVTGAILSTLPLERAGAGSAVANTVRQTGAVLGIAVLGTVMTIVYRRAAEPAVTGLPQPLRDKARSSAEIARHIATGMHRPALKAAVNDAFIHAMHVACLWAMAICLLGALTLLVTLRPAANPALVETVEAKENAKENKEAEQERELAKPR